MSRERKRTWVYGIFMACFLSMAAFLTYYSGVVYIKTLPRVEVVMPEESGLYKDGRCAYWVPGEAVHRKDAGTYYVHVARYIRDDLGERYRVEEVAVWVLEENQDGKVLVDGMIWVEPVVVAPVGEVATEEFVRLKNVN